jgi:hypothetical protein
MLERVWAGHVRRELIPLLAFDTPPAPAEPNPSPVCNVLVAPRTSEAVTRILAQLTQDGFAMP